MGFHLPGESEGVKVDTSNLEVSPANCWIRPVLPERCNSETGHSDVGWDNSLIAMFIATSKYTTNCFVIVPKRPYNKYGGLYIGSFRADTDNETLV